MAAFFNLARSARIDAEQQRQAHLIAMASVENDNKYLIDERSRYLNERASLLTQNAQLTADNARLRAKVEVLMVLVEDQERRLRTLAAQYRPAASQ